MRGEGRGEGGGGGHWSSALVITLHIAPPSTPLNWLCSTFSNVHSVQMTLFVIGVKKNYTGRDGRTLYCALELYT